MKTIFSISQKAHFLRKRNKADFATARDDGNSTERLLQIIIAAIMIKHRGEHRGL